MFTITKNIYIYQFLFSQFKEYQKYPFLSLLECIGFPNPNIPGTPIIFTDSGSGETSSLKNHYLSTPLN